MAPILRLVRPSPELVKARQREIAKRYRKRHRRSATSPQFAAIRIAELNRLFQARYGECLPNDVMGRQALAVVAHHLIGLDGHPQPRLMTWASLRTPWLTIGDAKALLAEISLAPRRWKADMLARLLQVMDAERTSLRITTIGAIDCNRWQRLERRMHRKRLRERARRRAAKAAACPP
jgi:hypothetical protein